MIRLFFLACLLVFASCKSKTKTETTVNNENSGKDTIIKSGNDPVSVTNLDEKGKVDIVNFGPLKLSQHYSETQEAMGPPDIKSKAIEWGADGLMHEDWTWKKNSILLNMSSDKSNKDSTLSVFSITAQSPCDFKTKAGVGMGSSYAEVEAAYKNEIDPYSTNKKQITVGDLYDGIIFTFKNDKAVKIFLGAAAE